MPYRKFAGCLLVHLAFAIAPAAAAEEWLTGAELERRCGKLIETPGEAGSEVCIAFVQGYLAGIEKARRSPAADAPREEGFAARAARTRAGGALQRFRTLQGNEYCVAENASGAEVVQRITAYLGAYSGKRTQGESAVELVHRALAQTFPCKNEENE